MEVILLTILTTIWWMLSFSLLFPFFVTLYFSKTVRDRWFSFFFSNFASRVFGPSTMPNRKRAFELLKKNLSNKNKDVPLEVLEVGIGTGANLEYYPESINLTALDMNISFEKYFRESKKKFPHINYEKTIINRAENMCDVADESFDVVIITFVLCSVTSLESVMKEVKRVLKPGGLYVFLEHVAYPKDDVRYFLQRYANPIWKIYFNGCCLGKNIEDYINNSGFRNVHCEKVYPPDKLLFIRPVIYGIATK